LADNRGTFWSAALWHCVDDNRQIEGRDGGRPETAAYRTGAPQGTDRRLMRFPRQLRPGLAVQGGAAFLLLCCFPLFPVDDIEHASWAVRHTLARPWADGSMQVHNATPNYRHSLR